MTTRREAWAEVRACAQALDELENRIMDALSEAGFGTDYGECIEFENAAAGMVLLLNYLGDTRDYGADVLDAPVESRP